MTNALLQFIDNQAGDDQLHTRAEFTRVIKQCNDRLSGLKSVRLNWESEWKDLRDYLCPRSGLSLDGGDVMDGRRRNQKIFNGKPQYYLNVLVAGLMSSVVPKTTPWFKFVCRDTLLNNRWSVKTWLKACEDLILDDLRRSKFYETTHTGFMHAAVFGSFVAGIFESEKNVIASRALDIGEFYLANDYDGDLDTVIREIYLTTVQLVNQFGVDNVSESVKRDYEQHRHLDKVNKVIHVVMPNDKNSLVGEHWTYQSLYYESNRSDFLLRAEGFDEMPFVTMPWNKEGNHTYGTSPSMHALGDIKELNKRAVKSLKASDEMIDPAMVFDGSFAQKMIHDYAGGKNFFDNMQTHSRTAATPLKPQNLNLSYYRQEKLDVEQRISEFFFTDLFLMLANDTRSNITAREVAERHEEKLMILGPVSDSFQRNYLIPTIERCFKIRERYNLLPPLPQDLIDQELNIDFIGTLAQAQKLVSSQSTQQFIGFVHSLAQVRPEVLHKISYDRLVDHMASSIGVDPNIMATANEIKQVRESEQQARQQAQSMQQFGEVAKGARDLSQAKTQDGRSMIDTMMEAQKNGQE